MRKSFGGLFRGAGRRLLVRVLLFSSVVTLVLTVLQLHRDYSHDVDIINTRLDEVGRGYLDSIGQGLWSLDESQLTLQLQGILRLPHIRAVEVHEITDIDRAITITVGQRGTAAVLAREFPIVYAVGDTEQAIGNLYVEASLAEVYRSLVDKGLFILAGQGAKTFLVSFFILYIFHRLVTRHLANIASFVADYRMGQSSRALTLDRRPPDPPDELDQVVSAFNVMTTGLQSTYDQLRRANAQLERDNAALSQAEAALRESEQLFRDYAEIASDWFWATGPDHRFTHISEGAAAAGPGLGSKIGALRWEFAADLESNAMKWHAHRQMLERHEPFRDFVYELYDGEGRRHYCSISGKPIFGQDGTFLGYRGTATDVTARSLAEARVRELSIAVEQSPAGIAIVDPDGRLVYSNRGFLQIVGLDGEEDTDAAGAVTMNGVLPPAVWQHLVAAARDGEVGSEEVFAERLSGGSFWGLVSVAGIRSPEGEAGNLVVALQDITREKAEQQEREALQRRLQETGKMEAIGRLAGGIAHDFNNLLGAMMGFSQFLVEDLPAGSASRRHAERISGICERGRDLVEQLLAFAGARDTERKVLDLSAVLRRCRDLMETSLPSSSKLVLENSDGPVPVLGNEGQLHQVLLNLCLNAKDALEGGPGTITVTLSQVRPGDEAGDKVQGAGVGMLESDRDYALIEVADTGSGMDADTQARIFEPFYTTKEFGRGSGLGLAVVRGIVTTYGGAIYVDSEPGDGTTFEIYLPLSDAPLAPEPEVAADRPGVRGCERILVVDDDPDLVQALTIGLNRYGYEVSSVTDPAMALGVLDDDPERWDLVVSDQVMPGMSGLTLIAKLKGKRPALRAILYTGFDEGIAAGTASIGVVDAVLHKPITPEALAAQIRALLDPPPPAP